jgi:hypothetical protein
MAKILVDRSGGSTPRSESPKFEISYRARSGKAGSPPPDPGAASIGRPAADGGSLGDDELFASVVAECGRGDDETDHGAWAEFGRRDDVTDFRA